jgi:hypothetical protein
MGSFEVVSIAAVIALIVMFARERMKQKEKERIRLEEQKERFAKKDSQSAHEAYKKHISAIFTREGYSVINRPPIALDEYEGIDLIASNEMEICLIHCKNASKLLVTDDYVKVFVSSCIKYTNANCHNEIKDVKFIYVLSGKMHETALLYIDKIREGGQHVEYRIISESTSA